jgi:hypothetical protein
LIAAGASVRSAHLCARGLAAGDERGLFLRGDGVATGADPSRVTWIVTIGMATSFAMGWLILLSNPNRQLRHCHDGAGGVGLAKDIFF